MVLPFALIGGATFATAAATALQPLRVASDGRRVALVGASVDLGAGFHPASTRRTAPVVKLAVDGIGASIAEGIGAVVILLWLKQAVPDGVLSMPLDTGWMVWVTLVTVAAWLLITQKLRVQVKKEAVDIKPAVAPDVECERFPDQCPCTTELGKGIA